MTVHPATDLFTGSTTFIVSDNFRSLSKIIQSTPTPLAPPKGDALASPEKPTLGLQEMEVLRFVAVHTPISVEVVTDQFGESRGLERTTIMAVLERLRKKGYLIRTKSDDGNYQYSPSIAQNEVLLSLVQTFVEKSLGGSIAPFVAYLSDQTDLSTEELEELIKLLEALNPARETGTNYR